MDFQKTVTAERAKNRSFQEYTHGIMRQISLPLICYLENQEKKLFGEVIIFSFQRAGFLGTNATVGQLFKVRVCHFPSNLFKLDTRGL